MRKQVEFTHDDAGFPLAKAVNIQASFHPDADEDELVLDDLDD